MLGSVLTLLGLALCIAIGLTVVRRLTTASQQPQDSVIETINAILPQTQCGQCNYPGCRPYATAIIEEDAAINQCPPGGQATIAQLAELLGREALPLNASNGEEAPARIAFIHEAQCIGCKKCILACPVDAIVGAAKRMHTVITTECTGCDLCVEPCPVDCIDMIEPPIAINNWRTPFPTKHYAFENEPVPPGMSSAGGK